jgi:hypothetical protein
MCTGLHEPSQEAVHEFVQLLAGWVPDEELAGVRRTRADGQPAAAGAAAVALVAEYGVPLLAGHREAGVEVVALDTAPLPYQAAALEGSALLRAAQDGEETPSDDEAPLSR